MNSNFKSNTAISTTTQTHRVIASDDDAKGFYSTSPTCRASLTGPNRQAGMSGNLAKSMFL